MTTLPRRKLLTGAIANTLTSALALSSIAGRPALACHRQWDACFPGANQPIPPPKEPKDDLPYGGKFYGCLLHSQTIGNTRFTKGRPVSIRFRAERSGLLTSILWNMRYNGISSQGKTETAYSIGNGGLVFIELRKNIQSGGPSQWWPDMSTSGLLTQTLKNNGQSEPLVGSYAYPVWPFTKPVAVTSGAIYHLVFHQLDANNALSVNLHTSAVPIPWGTPGGRAGPYYKDDWAHLWALDNYETNGWFHRPHHAAFVEFYYSDGHVSGVGEAYASDSSRKTIGGLELARERFTVSDYTRSVNGVWFRVWYETGTPSNLVIRLEDEVGSIIEEVTIARSEIPKADLTTTAAPWTYQAFSSLRLLEKGKTYRISFRCANGAYKTSAIQDGGAKGYRSRNRWIGALAEFSTDGGTTWNGWTIDKFNPNEYRTDMHMGVGFTVAES